MKDVLAELKKIKAALEGFGDGKPEYFRTYDYPDSYFTPGKKVWMLKGNTYPFEEIEVPDKELDEESYDWYVKKETSED